MKPLFPTLYLLLLFLALPALAATVDPGARTARPLASKAPAAERSPVKAPASANDLCADATAIPSSGPFPWIDAIDTTGNITDGTSWCGGDADAWYAFTPDATGRYSISTCGSDFDTILSLYTGICGALAELDCNDDACGLQSILLEDLVGGIPYMIRVSGYNGAVGNASLTVKTLPPTAPVTAWFAVDTNDLIFGTGYADPSDTVWISEVFNAIDREWQTFGGVTGVAWPANWTSTTGAWPADMEFDAGRGVMYQVDVLGDNCIHAFDPASGTETGVICDPTGYWSGVSQRGVAHDPYTDTLYVGGWNDGIIYQIGGLSGNAPGTILNYWPFPGVAGLAWMCSQELAVVVSDADDSLYVLDPATMAEVARFSLPDGGGVPTDRAFAGAGIDCEPRGDLPPDCWLVNQDTLTAYAVDLGRPCITVADVSVQKSAAPEPAEVGATLTYTITVSNAGPEEASSVTLSDPLPAQVSFVSSTPSQGSCVYDAPTHTVDCDLGLLSPAASAQVTIETTVDEAGSFTNTATAATSSRDLDGSNDSDSAETTTPALFDLILYDDSGRACVSVNTETGDWLWRVLELSGGGAYSGTGIASIRNGILRIVSAPGEPWQLVLRVYLNQGMAYGSFVYRPYRVRSSLYDRNITNNPPVCQ